VTVLIVSESYFGNTLTVTEAIASGIADHLGPDAVTILRPGGAPHELPPEVDLLLVGAPTHEFSMPKAQSRRQAVEKGATDGDSVGVREWLQNLTPRGDEVHAGVGVQSRLQVPEEAWVPSGRTGAKLLRRGHSRTPGRR